MPSTWKQLSEPCSHQRDSCPNTKTAPKERMEVINKEKNFGKCTQRQITLCILFSKLTKSTLFSKGRKLYQEPLLPDANEKPCWKSYCKKNKKTNKPTPLFPMGSSTIPIISQKRTKESKTKTEQLITNEELGPFTNSNKYCQWKRGHKSVLESTIVLGK